MRKTRGRGKREAESIKEKGKEKKKGRREGGRGK